MKNLLVRGNIDTVTFKEHWEGDQTGVVLRSFVTVNLLSGDSFTLVFDDNISAEEIYDDLLEQKELQQGRL